MAIIPTKELLKNLSEVQKAELRKTVLAKQRELKKALKNTDQALKLLSLPEKKKPIRHLSVAEKKLRIVGE